MTLGEIVTLLAYGVGAAVFYLAAREKGVATQGMARLAAVGVGFGILGAKVTQLVSEGAAPMQFFEPTLGGRSLVGGLIFGWAAVEIAKARMGIRSSTGGLFALALPAGEAVGRIGCHLNGCCYGIETSGPLAVWQHGAWRCPSQLYSAAASLALFGVLWSVRRRFDARTLFRLYLIGWGTARFALEFVREGSRPMWGLTMMQLFAFEIAAVAGIALWLAARRRPAAIREAR